MNSLVPFLRHRVALLLLAAFLGVTVRSNANELDDEKIELPAPTGKFAVGTVALNLTDCSRVGIYDDGPATRGREIGAQIWYPAAAQPGGGTSPYTDALTMGLALHGEVESEPAAVDLIQTHAFVGAPMPGGHHRFPVLLFSPGLGLFFAVYQGLFEDLASHGYIVVALNSPDAAGITVGPDGRTHLFLGPPDSAGADAWLDAKFRLVTDDLKFVARQLSVLDHQRGSPLAGRIKTSAIGCFGHSLGGAAAVQACTEMPALAGAVNIDGTFHGPGFRKRIIKPMMVILADNHPADGTLEVFWQNLAAGGCRLKFAGTGHLSFTDEPFLLQAAGEDPAQNPDFGRMDPAQCLEGTREALRGFFDSLQGGIKTGCVALPALSSTEVVIEVKPPAGGAKSPARLADNSCRNE